jgi:hypothetical protein
MPGLKGPGRQCAPDGSYDRGAGHIRDYMGKARPEDAQRRPGATRPGPGPPYWPNESPLSRCRAMTIRWISEVPSPISPILASRIIRSTG